MPLILQRTNHFPCTSPTGDPPPRHPKKSPAVSGSSRPGFVSHVLRVPPSFQPLEGPYPRYHPPSATFVIPLYRASPQSAAAALSSFFARGGKGKLEGKVWGANLPLARLTVVSLPPLVRSDVERCRPKLLLPFFPFFWEGSPRNSSRSAPPSPVALLVVVARFCRMAPGAVAMPSYQGSMMPRPQGSRRRYVVPRVSCLLGESLSIQ